MQLPRAAGPLKACQHLMAAASPSARSIIHTGGPAQGFNASNAQFGCLRRGLEGFRKCAGKRVMCLGSAGSDRMVTTGAAAYQEAAVKADSYKPKPRIKEIKVGCCYMCFWD